MRCLIKHKSIIQCLFVVMRLMLESAQTQRNFINDVVAVIM